ncbi:MAG TPA: LysR family transcriptional regulator [Polyangiaceae bacterium]|nr:LysR family transcriptional regulator [Polyangiaceae bacterium]
MAAGPDWNDLRFFLALVRSGGLRGAATLLGVDATTVGRRLSALERRLGVPLFDRRPEGLALTEVGARLVANAEAVERGVADFERAAEGGKGAAEGELRVTTTELLGPLLVVPNLPEFVARHPAVELRLMVTLKTLDLARREADVALRIASRRPEGDALVARPGGETPLAIYASDAYLRRRGVPQSDADLAGHDWLGGDESTAGVPEARWLAARVRPARFALRSASPRVLLDACQSGLGLGVFGRFVEASCPSLRRLPLGEGLPTHAIWVTYHREARALGKVRAFVDFFLTLMGREGARLRGEPAPAGGGG